MGLLEQAKVYLAEHGSEFHRPEELPAESLVQPGNMRTTKTQLLNSWNEESAELRGNHALLLIARIAVDVGVIRVEEGSVVITGGVAIQEHTLDEIEVWKPDIIKTVGELQRARQYGEWARSVDVGQYSTLDSEGHDDREVF